MQEFQFPMIFKKLTFSGPFFHSFPPIQQKNTLQFLENFLKLIKTYLEAEITKTIVDCFALTIAIGNQLSNLRKRNNQTVNIQCPSFYFIINHK